jgi:hypothetical protein
VPTNGQMCDRLMEGLRSRDLLPNGLVTDATFRDQRGLAARNVPGASSSRCRRAGSTIDISRLAPSAPPPCHRRLERLALL